MTRRRRGVAEDGHVQMHVLHEDDLPLCWAHPLLVTLWPYHTGQRGGEGKREWLGRFPCLPGSHRPYKSATKTLTMMTRSSRLQRPKRFPGVAGKADKMSWLLAAPPWALTGVNHRRLRTPVLVTHLHSWARKESSDLCTGEFSLPSLVTKSNSKRALCSFLRLTSPSCRLEFGSCHPETRGQGPNHRVTRGAGRPHCPSTELPGVALTWVREKRTLSASGPLLWIFK